MIHPFQPQITMLDYLKQHGWKPARDHGQEEVPGPCPFHRETRPSFYVNRRKQVFYCHGCGRCGSLFRLRQLFDDVTPLAEPRTNRAELLHATYSFYQQQLCRNSEATAYLSRRGIHDPAVMERMQIGYAPGACLRGYLMHLGFTRQILRDCGLIDDQGRDSLFHCLTFPLEETGNLYGRSVTDGPYPHRFLPRPKGGLYGWVQGRLSRSIILVEGLFDLASLWQAGFNHAVAALGSHLNSRQLEQLESATGRTIYLCFDADQNGSGQRAARYLNVRLRETGITVRRVELPRGQDPNSLLASTGREGIAVFQQCLEQAR